MIAKISKRILGADFLHKFNLLIDINKRRLIDGLTQLSIQGNLFSITNDLTVTTLNKCEKFSNLLLQYPELTKPIILPTQVKHDVKHFIETKGQPIHSKARQLDPKRLAIAKKEFKFMLDNEIIRPSSSQWDSPLHLTTKKDETIRPCGNYRQLNAQTIPDRYPIPRIEDFHHILKNTTIISKIDLIKAYYQIPIAEEDKCYLISQEGSRPLPEKVQAIINYKKPETLHDLRTFLGMINFYRRYLKDAAKTQTLLHDYLKGAKKRDRRKIQWSDEAEKQFEKCKNDLINTTLFSFPKTELPLALITDTSDTAIGSVLQQLGNDTWKPIGFYSKKT
ncbi:retrovirus-related Pol polyprotein from transposon 297 [Nephila pilipes]|uniref:Retrovirus-related Pol polyprotein from transposon 297 n=1 Tax=Nephila pilipes TaxID=299642 RepID=A0A8X6UDV3_NEPPI|nr:retrovirus-related Pol polyprotein from transposon 297 [Nephila pilipes]